MAGMQSCEQHYENSFQLHGIQVSGVIQKLSINRITNLAKLPMTVNVHSKNVGDLVLSNNILFLHNCATKLNNKIIMLQAAEARGCGIVLFSTFLFRLKSFKRFHVFHGSKENIPEVAKFL